MTSSVLSSEKAVVSLRELEAMAAACKVTDVDRAARALAGAGVIVPLADGGFHLRPVQLLAALDGGSFRLEAGLEQEHAAAVANETVRRRALQEAIDRASKLRQSVWAGALLFSGAQLAIISRLTYFDLDWDIMEPVSYFIGTGTAIVFYLYMLWFRREHSYTEFDATHLPRWVQRHAPKDFDWDAYRVACERVDGTHRAVEAAKAWAATR